MAKTQWPPWRPRRHLSSVAQSVCRSALLTRISRTKCLLFELEQGGSRLHWKVADMHTVGCFDQVMKKSPSRWLHRRWKAWRSFLCDMGCPLTLCRGTAIGAPLEEPSGAMDRVHPWPALPTYGMLALLMRRAWGANAMQVDPARLAIAEYAHALIKPLSLGRWCVVLTFDDSHWAPPSSYAHKDAVWLRCSDGFIDLGPLRGHSRFAGWSDARKSSLRRVLGLIGHALQTQNLMQFVDFVTVLAENMHRHRDVLRCFAQSMFSLSLHAEDVLATNSRSSNEILAEPVRHGGVELSSSDVDYTAHVRDQRLARYLNECKSVTENVRTFSIAIDASRVGKRGLHLGVFLAPSGVAFWMAPPET